MAASVSVVNKNPTFSPYAVDDPMPDLPAPYTKDRGHDNHAYENCVADKTDPSHHYEDPLHLKNGTSQRRKMANPIYDTADAYPRPSTKYQEEPVQPYKESRLGFVLLFVILLISLVALVLVIMIILGKLGPACTCTNTASPTAQKLQEHNTFSLQKIYDEMYALKRNLSTVKSELNQKISVLRNELNDAKNQIQLLKEVNDIASLWQQANKTRDKLNNHESTHNLLHQQIQKAINDTIDKCNAGDASLKTKLQAQELKERHDVAQLQKNISETMDKCVNVNNTLTAKIDTLTKMEGPMGPRGYNGSQGAQGLKGDKGDTGTKGDRGDKGDTGAKGDKGDQGIKGDKGDTGAIGAVGPQGAGNLTQCDVKRATPSSGASGGVSSLVLKVKEPAGKKILYFACSSNYADTVEQEILTPSGAPKEFVCLCYGKGTNPTSPSTTKCYMTYAECPLIS